MNRKQVVAVFAICVAMAVGPALGPLVGDWVAGVAGSRVATVLPWLLITIIWLVLITWIRRARTAR